jgi:sulfur carrier protein
VMIINGEEQNISASTIAELLKELDYEGTFYAIALNGTLVPRAAWANTQLSEGDRVEIVTPRQGG